MPFKTLFSCVCLLLGNWKASLIQEAKSSDWMTKLGWVWEEEKLQNRKEMVSIFLKKKKKKEEVCKVKKSVVYNIYLNVLLTWKGFKCILSKFK